MRINQSDINLSVWILPERDLREAKALQLVRHSGLG